MHSIPIAEDDAPPALDEPAIDLSADLRGRVLMGRYELAELFFHGELGSVYLGHDQHSGRPVEVKILAPSAAGSGLVERFRERSRRMLGLANPGLAAVYGEGLTENGLAFAITEHREGRNLHHMHGDPRLVWPAPEAVVRQLAEALQALHAVGVVHGAVSPGNIVWIEGARAAQVQLVDREFRQTPAPDTEEPDTRTDLHALGAVVYELCTGRAPDHPHAALGMHDADVEIAVPTAFEAVILALVDRDPNNRPGSAIALLDLLDRASATAGMGADDLDFLAALEEPGGVPSRFQPVEPSRPMPTSRATWDADLPTRPPSQPFGAAQAWPRADSQPAPAAPQLPRGASQPFPAAPQLPPSASQPFPAAAPLPPPADSITLADLREMAERDSPAAAAQPVLFQLDPLGDRKPTLPPTASDPTGAPPVLFALDALGDRKPTTLPPTPVNAPTPATAQPTLSPGPADAASAQPVLFALDALGERKPTIPPTSAKPATAPPTKLDAVAPKPEATPAVPTPRPAHKVPARRPPARGPLILGLVGAVIAIGLLVWLIQSCRSDDTTPSTTPPPAATARVVTPAGATPPSPAPTVEPANPQPTPATPEPAPTTPEPATPEPAPTPATPETTPAAGPPTEPATELATELPEQLSAQEFRRVMLRINRSNQVRTCYRRHARPGEEEVSMIGTITPAGKIQKLRLEPAIPLSECLKPIVLKMEFPQAVRSAQHNFIFRNVAPDGAG